jgi:hypothetical protein
VHIYLHVIFKQVDVACSRKTQHIKNKEEGILGEVPRGKSAMDFGFLGGASQDS